MISNRKSLFAIACIGLFAFGVVLTTLGAVLPLVIERFGISRAAAGSLLLVNTLGIIGGSLIFGPIVDRYGYKEMLLIAFLIVVAGMQGIAFSPSMIALQLAVACAGIGGGMVNGGTNALVADIFHEDRTGALGRVAVAFGVGAVGTPFVLGTLLGAFSYTTVVAALGVSLLVPAIATALARFPAPKQPQGFPLAEAGGLLRDPTLLIFGAALFVESGMELTVGGWTSTFFSQELRTTDRVALVCLSVYWCGLMVGRMGMSAALRVVSPMRLLRACLSVGFIGTLLLLGTREPLIAAIAVFLVGLGFSATFPTVLGMVADRYAALSGTAFGVVMVMALTGGMSLPFVTGLIGGAHGLRAALAVVPCALVLLVGVLTAAQARRRAPTLSASPTDGR